MKRKLLSVLLTLCLAFSLLPTAALAVEGETSGEVVQQGSSVSLPENNRGNFTISEEGAVLDGTGVTYTDGTITVTAADVTIKNLIFGDKAKLVVNTSGKFTLTGCTFAPQTVYDKATRLPVRTAVNLNVGEAEVTNNTFEGVTNGYYNAIEFGIGAGDNDLKAATISGNTFKSAIANNYFSFYNMTNGAQIDIVNNKLLLAAKSSNGIRISNYRNATGVTFNIDSDEYTYATDSADSEYEGLILLQDYSKDSAVQNFSDITLNVTNLTAPESAKQLLYVYDNQAGIISTNQPVVKGDSSIEKFFVAKVDKTYYKTLADAVAAANNATVTLLKDVTTNVTIPAGKSITLDLDGKKLTVPDDVGIKVKGKLTVTGNGTVTCTRTPFMVNAGELVIENGAVSSDSDYGIYALNDGKVTVNGGTLTSLYSPLTGNNTTGNMNFTVNGGTLTAKSGPAIYMPGQVSMTITDGVLNGGISLRMGQVNISGGTINAVTTGFGMPTETVSGKPVYAYSGNVWFPDALYVIGGTYTSTDTTYGNSLTLNITGGTFNCTNGKGSAVAIYDLGKVAQTANVTISGDAKFATNSAERSAYQVVSFADMNATPIEDYGKSDLVGKVSTAITGGLFSSDVTKYCAEGLMAVENKDTTTKTTYPYTIGEVPDAAIAVAITEHTQAGATDGSVSESVTDRTAAEAVARSVTTDVASTAGAIEITDTEKKTAIQQLLADGQIELDENGNVTAPTGSSENVTVTIIKQPYLDVEVTALNSTTKELSLTIEPKYNLLATTDKDNSNKSVVVSTGNALTVTGEMEVTLALPNGFAAAGNKLSIKHTKGNSTVEYYTGTVSVENGNLYVTFTTKGFSPFTISAPTASIGETMYPTLAEAIAKAANGNAVKLEKNCTESVSVSGKSLTIDKNNHEYDFAEVTVDSNSTKTENGDTLTITYTAPSYYSGGSSSDPTYSVSTPSKTEHGSVTVSPKSASKGDTVTVTVKPDSGYVLETLTVTDKNGNELTLKDKGNGKYTFTMPSGKVEVKATFMEDNSMLNFFYDVPNDAYFYEAVKWAVKNGITTGVGNDLFAPEQPCTRAQIVTFLWRAAGSPEPKGAASGMTDVVSGSYYEKAVAWAIENGITTGTTTTTFSPDATCTRAQAVTFLARALNAKAASAAEFSDVPTDSYFADAVAWAAANGVTEGIGGGLFGSDNDCTRGQIVTFLYRAYNK